MKIIIHRGIDQIGGCITEITTDKARILIDLGQNLPDGEGNVDDDLASRDAIEKITRGMDAVFYTHYHGDHLGLFHYVPDRTRQYIGKVAKQVALCKHRQLSFIKNREELSNEEIGKLERMSDLTPQQIISVGDIKVTPYFVSHSAYDAYMFLIKADGKRVLHTGDFRGHGYLSSGLLPTIKEVILPQGNIDFLITERTMLSRISEIVMTENELRKEALKIMRKYKNVFVMCSSTDMERLASFFAANADLKNRPLVCDRFQKDILEIFSKSAGNHSSLFRFEKLYDFSPKNIKLISWMKDKGFCMFVRATDKFKLYYDTLKSQLEPNETVLIYSMWKEYINAEGKHTVQRYMDFVSMFPNVEKLHTSGHASDETLAEVCNLVSPAHGIIPIHSEDSGSYSKLPIEDYLRQRIITKSCRVADVSIEINQKSKTENKMRKLNLKKGGSEENKLSDEPIPHFETAEERLNYAKHKFKERTGLKDGAKVRYIGVNDVVIDYWGGKYTDPRGILNTETIYEIECIEIHRSFSIVKLIGYPDDVFNGVIFEAIDAT